MKTPQEYSDIYYDDVFMTVEDLVKMIQKDTVLACVEAAKLTYFVDGVNNNMKVEIDKDSMLCLLE